MYSDHETLCLDSTFLSNSLSAYFSHLRFMKFILFFCLIHLELSYTLHALILLQNLTSSCLLQLMRSQNLSMNPMTFAVILIRFLPLFLRNENLHYFQLSPISSIFLLFLLISLNSAQFILSLRNLIVIKMTCVLFLYYLLFLICFSFLN